MRLLREWFNILKLDLSRTFGLVTEEELKNVESFPKLAPETVVGRTGAGSEFLGWVDLPVDYDKAEFERILKSAEKIKSDSDALVVIGIGGSYLGAKAAIEMLTHTFHNELPKDQKRVSISTTWEITCLRTI